MALTEAHASLNPLPRLIPQLEAGTLALAFGLLLGCTPDSPQARVREAVEAVEAAPASASRGPSPFELDAETAGCERLNVGVEPKPSFKSQGPDGEQLALFSGACKGNSKPADLIVLRRDASGAPIFATKREAPDRKLESDPISEGPWLAYAAGAGEWERLEVRNLQAPHRLILSFPLATSFEDMGTMTLHAARIAKGQLELDLSWTDPQGTPQEAQGATVRFKLDKPCWWRHDGLFPRKKLAARLQKEGHDSAFLVSCEGKRIVSGEDSHPFGVD